MRVGSTPQEPLPCSAQLEQAQALALEALAALPAHSAAVVAEAEVLSSSSSAEVLGAGEEEEHQDDQDDQDDQGEEEEGHASSHAAEVAAGTRTAALRTACEEEVGSVHEEEEEGHHDDVQGTHELHGSAVRHGAEVVGSSPAATTKRGGEQGHVSTNINNNKQEVKGKEEKNKTRIA